MGTPSKRSLPGSLENVPFVNFPEDEDFSSAKTAKEALGLRFQKQTITLRKDYGKAMLSLVIGQALAINTYFVLIGTGLIHVDADVFKTFAVSVYAAIVSLALVVTRSLFPIPEQSVIDKASDFVKDRLNS